MGDNALTTYQKASRINLDEPRHGTFAEVGAGQEVVRWFFHVGGAAGTVAKTVSAYDMAISHAYYGPAERYVSRGRLKAMLDKEAPLQRRRHHLRLPDSSFGIRRVDDFGQSPDPPGVAIALRLSRRQGSAADSGGVDAQLLRVLPSDVLAMIHNGDPTWQDLVPKAAGETIKKHRLFGLADGAAEA